MYFFLVSMLPSKIYFPTKNIFLKITWSGPCWTGCWHGTQWSDWRPPPSSLASDSSSRCSPGGWGRHSHRSGCRVQTRVLTSEVTGNSPSTLAVETRTWNYRFWAPVKRIFFHVPEPEIATRRVCSWHSYSCTLSADPRRCRQRRRRTSCPPQSPPWWCPRPTWRSSWLPPGPQSRPCSRPRCSWSWTWAVWGWGGQRSWPGRTWWRTERR